MGVADHATPLYPQKLALISSTSGGRSAGIVCSQTKVHGVCFLIMGVYPERLNYAISNQYSKNWKKPISAITDQYLQ
jgi:hypothetical protein